MANNGKGGGKGSSGISPDQIAIATKLGDLMDRMAATGSRLEKSFQTQASAMQEMAEAMKKMDAGETVAQLKEVNQTLKLMLETLKQLQGSSSTAFAAMANDAEKAGTTAQTTSEQIKSVAQNVSKIDNKPISKLTSELNKTKTKTTETNKASTELGKFFKGGFVTAIGAASGALGGLGQGLRNIAAVSRGITGVVGGLAKGLFKVGQSILSIPFKMLQGLTDMADSMDTGISELAQSFNDLRKEFGSLQGPTNAAIIGTASAMGNLELAGTSAMAVFGNLADRQKALMELYSQGGPAIRSFAGEIQKGNGAVLAFQKGLGLSSESMEGLAQRARASGEPITKTLINITKQADSLGKKFGLDSKIISREMGKASQDMLHFGHVSEKQIGVAVTYAQKLGISLDKITGSFDKFSTFDDAAENISKLNEAFGSNIDIGEVMQEQDPAKQFEMIRKGLSSAGVQGEKMTAVQKKLLEGATGWDAATAEAALSSKNAGISLKDIQKQGDKAESSTMSQADAMNKLADAMERTLKSGSGPQAKGFFDKFTSGISDGITSTKEFRDLMMSMKRAFAVVYTEGRRLGREIVNLFPGVKEVFTGLTGMFNSGKFKDLVKGVVDTFVGFMKDLREGKASFPKLMEDLKTKFFNFFHKESPEGQKVLGGFKQIFGAIGNIIAQAIPWIMGKVTDFIRKFTEFVTNPTAYLEKAKAAAAAGAGGVSPFMQPILEGINKSLPALSAALKDLGKALFEKLKEALGTNLGKGVLAGAVGMLVGPAIIQGLTGAGTGSMIKKATGGFSSLLGKNTKNATEAAAEAGAAGAGKAADLTSSPAAMIASSVPSKEDIEKMQAASTAKIDWKGLIKFLLGLAGVFAIGLAGFKVALEIVKGESMEDLAKAGLVMLTLTPVMAAAGELAKSLSEIGDVNFASMMKTVLAVAGFMLVGLGAFWVALRVVSGVPIGDIIKAAIALVAVTGVMGAVALLLPIATIVGAIAEGAAKEMAVGMLALGLAVIAIAGVAWIVTKMLGGLDAASLTKATVATAAMVPVFLATGAVIAVAALIGAGIIESAGVGAAFIIVGMLAMGLAIVAMAETANIIVKMLGAIPVGKIVKTVLLMTFMTALFAASGVIITEAGLIGAAIIASFGAGAAAVIIGMAAMSKAIFFIAETATTLIESLGGVSLKNATTTALIMMGTIGLFVAAGAIIAEAGAIGATIMASWGAGAAAIAIGMKAIRFAIDNIADAAISVISKLSEIKEDPGAVKTKAEAFGAIMSGLAQMLSAVSKILDSMDFGYFESADDMAKRVGAVQDFVKQLIDGSDGKGGIKGIITEITRALTEASAEQLEKGKSFAEILSSLAKLMEVLTGPAMEIQKQTSHWYNSAEEDAKQAKASFKNLNGYITTVSTQAGTLVKTMVDILKGFTEAEIKSLKDGGSAIAAILGAIGQLAQALKPPDLKVEGGGMGSDTTVNFTIPSIQDVLNGLIKKLPTLVDTLKKLITGMPTGEEFLKQIETAKKVFDSIKPLAAVAASLTEMGKEDKKFDSEAIKTKLKQLQGFFYDLTQGDGSIAGLFFQATQLAGQMGDASRFDALKESASKNLDSIKATADKIIESIGDEKSYNFGAVKTSLKNLTGFYYEVNTNIGGLVFQAEELKKKIGGFTGFEAVATVIGSMDKSGRTIIDALKNLTGSSIADLANATKEFFPQFANLLDAIVISFPVDTISMATGLIDVAEVTNLALAKGVIPAVAAVEDMVNSAKRLEKSLQEGAKIDIDTKLKVFASKFGKNLGSAGAYTVQTKDVVLNVNFRIAMDAHELEGVMVRNSNSVIKEKINLLLDAVPDNDDGKKKRDAITKGGVGVYKL